jgi:hypothetical protein
VIDHISTRATVLLFQSIECHLFLWFSAFVVSGLQLPHEFQVFDSANKRTLNKCYVVGKWIFFRNAL